MTGNLHIQGDQQMYKHFNIYNIYLYILLQIQIEYRQKEDFHFIARLRGSELRGDR
jgi:hypothetical protein